jgi:hypothetical protein
MFTVFGPPRNEEQTFKRNADGFLTLYAGAKSPEKDEESSWLAAPDGRFFSLSPSLL